MDIVRLSLGLALKCFFPHYNRFANIMDQYNREWRRNRVLVMQLAISSDSEESEEEQSAANGGSETQSSCHLVKEEDGGDVSCHDSPDSHSDFATSDDAFTSSDSDFHSCFLQIKRCQALGGRDENIMNIMKRCL
jgi:hypothetical protein